MSRNAKLPPIDEILVVTPEIERLLGKTAAQIRRMTLRELADAAFDKGFRWRVAMGDGLVVGLTIRVGDEPDTEPGAVQP